MGFLDKLFGNGAKVMEIGAPVEGECVPISAVNDPTFGEEILGKGIAIRPANGLIKAPADGTVTTVFPTGHAVAVTTTEGVEILIHVGLETVELNGDGFTKHVEEGQEVKKGDLLIEADLVKIGEKYDIITPMVICNTGDYKEVEGETGKTVAAGDTVIRIQV
ncbi:MAG: PTS glucose transporter subunit IIA [Lachnospiraceae bacterium]|nr:PTS glucose transporter subunit IIA [Lachnospiraceae bacterium]